MEVGGKFEAPAALSTGKYAPVHCGCTALSDSSEDRNLWPLRRVERRFVGYPARGLVITLSTLSPLLTQYYTCNYLTTAAK